MVWQELNPVCTPCRFGIRSIVSQNIKEALILKSKINRYLVTLSFIYQFHCSGRKWVDSKIEVKLKSWNFYWREVGHDNAKVCLSEIPNLINHVLLTILTILTMYNTGIIIWIFIHNVNSLSLNYSTVLYIEWHSLLFPVHHWFFPMFNLLHICLFNFRVFLLCISLQIK